ncbi:amino acid synthesis family protein [Ferrovibrio sp. MS7]|uniref:amino acid synthesis family protein n=1 Tax=Ferrovibrio plantarum TaxID=3119164 RepID=UPI003134FDFA
MSRVDVRKFYLSVEEAFHEGGPRPEKPLLRAGIAVVLRNPFAGRYEPDIMPFMDELKPLGLEMSQRLINVLGGDPKRIESYGKGSIIGEAGEMEHGALWHVPGGYGMRGALGGPNGGDTKAIVPSVTKVGGMGASIDVPLHHVNAAYVRSHFDAFELRVPDAPRANELVYVIAMATGPRLHHRVGGLQAHEIKGEDGLR